MRLQIHSRLNPSHCVTLSESLYNWTYGIMNVIFGQSSIIPPQGPLRNEQRKWIIPSNFGTVTVCLVTLVSPFKNRLMRIQTKLILITIDVGCNYSADNRIQNGHATNSNLWHFDISPTGLFLSPIHV